MWVIPELNAFPLIFMALVSSWSSQFLFMSGKSRQLLARSFLFLGMFPNYDRSLHVVINSRRSWDSVVFVSEQGKEDLLVWRDNLVCSNSVLFWPNPFVPSKVLFSDASLTGCSAFVQGFDLVCQRNWSTEESQKSSTWRELVAVKFALEAFESHLAGQSVRCNTAN